MARGAMYYDGTCRFCTGGANRLRPMLESRGIEVLPFENGAAEKEMIVRWEDGREYGGADAVFFLSSKIWWAWPVWLAGWIPGVKALGRVIYRKIASKRHCLNGACELPRR